MNYKIAVGFSIVELEIRVEELLKAKWQCQGGLVIEIVENKSVYLQAMTRD